MRYLVIAKCGFKDVGVGEASEIDAAFDSAVSGFMHYAINERIITNANDPAQRNKALADKKPFFEVRYIG